MKINTNIPEAQMRAIESLLASSSRNEYRARYTYLHSRTRTALWTAELANEDEITAHGIQSFCATILTKYTGATHLQIHSALSDYQRLFG